jgi:predicted enzyme related to lactoylglutathione lyase
MLTRESYPPGVPCWIDLSVPDPRAAVQFSGGLFGWEFEDRMPPGSGGHYFMARLQGGDVAAIGSAPEGDPAPVAWNTYVCVDSADETAARVVAAGGSMIAPPTDVFDAGRFAVFADPPGAIFSVWQPGRHKGAQIVNAPGSWNWSDLNSRDLEAARKFYGDVFGWETTTVDFGGAQSYMLRRPGYADFLEALDPGVRQRHSEAGAPEGFSDAIGWLQPMPPEQFPADVPSHWAVTFSVADTDAAAKRAVELGGTLLMPPMDLPYVRIATVRDPQGAVFTISRYTPG